MRAFPVNSRSIALPRASARGRNVVLAATRPNGKPTAPYNVLITGSSRGVGRALAEEFLRHGDNVVITSRNADKVAQEVAVLQRQFASQKVIGMAADVSRPDQVRALGEFAQSSLGSIDLWINNAGSNAYAYGNFIDAKDDDIRTIVETNILGVMFGVKEAIRLMKDQPGGGHVWLMDGAGADGNPTPRFAVYGSTKRSLEQFSKSVRSELQATGITNVGVHNLSPGMVTTELLMSVLLPHLTGANTSPTANFFINALAEEAPTVAAFLVPLVRKVPQQAPPMGGSTPSGTYIRFLTQQKALGKIFSRLLTGKSKNRFVPE